MANTAEIAGAGGARRGWFVPTGGVAALAAVGAPTRAIPTGDRRHDVVLGRNEVMQEALGGRTWFGALANASDEPVADVAVQIRFHDAEGRPVGTPLGARAARLEPGGVLHLQARLPAGAAGLSLHALRWTAGGRRVALGPSAPLAFGALPD